MTMRAMVMGEPRRPLALREVSRPEPGPGELLIEVEVCAICRTDLHVIDGELTEPSLPLIPGHQIVGRVAALGPAREPGEDGDEDGESGRRFAVGDRVGVPWLGATCRRCPYCTSGRENLCDDAVFTGYQRDGGFAEYAACDEQFALAIPKGYTSRQAAPLLCAGLIGYRTLAMAGEARRVGIYGFGSAAHIVAQVAAHQGREVYAFTRPGDERGQAFARSLGAAWAGGSDQAPPALLDAALIFAPVGALVPAALRAVAKGGIVVCGGIHMSDIPSFPYDILWGERAVKSVANLTRRDGEEFLAIAPRIPIETTVHDYALADANRALGDLRAGAFDGAAVLAIG